MCALGARVRVRPRSQHEDQVDWVFVDHISFHRPGNPYGNAHGVYADNLFRFSLLSMAAIEATLVLNVGGYRCACHLLSQRPPLSC